MMFVILRCAPLGAPRRMTASSCGATGRRPRPAHPIRCRVGGEFLIALAAVEQMPAHGRARLRHRSAADRLHDVAMLPLEGLAVDALGYPRSTADGLARNDEAPEMLQQPPELRIAGGVGNAAMKREVLIDGVLPARERGVDGLQAIDDLASLRRAKRARPRDRRPRSRCRCATPSRRGLLATRTADRSRRETAAAHWPGRRRRRLAG